jgi:DNA-binding NtrC family response regulator
MALYFLQTAVSPSSALNYRIPRHYLDTSGVIRILDNDRKTRDLLSAYLTYRGYEVVPADPGAPIFDTVGDTRSAILIANLEQLAQVADTDIRQARSSNPSLVMITYGSDLSQAPPQTENTFFLSTPLNLDELESLVMRAREYQSMKMHDTGEASQHPHELASSIIGRSKRMLELFELIGRIAESNATVLIQGESGTGKELAARAIHQLSARAGNNFVPINCAAIPDDLMESELFGHTKGAFTGAYASRAGRFEMADKGTLFLDEIGDMKPHLQVKLLRVLQNKEFEPVGSTKSQKVDVRIIAASNRNLEQLVDSGDFREDLFYRLSVIPITIPPLRERQEDIPLLIHTFLGRFNREKKHAIAGFSREAIDILCAYSWPGNVRELENLVERLVILKDSGMITADDLPERYLSGASRAPVSTAPVAGELPVGGICLNSSVEEFENRLILQALARTRGNKKEAAQLLNLKRTTLIEKLKKKNLVYAGDRE